MIGRELEFEQDHACPEDPDGQHFVGCGCDYASPDDPEPEPIGRRSPVEIWGEITAAAEELGCARAVIDTHPNRQFDAASDWMRAAARIGALIEELHQLGLIDEIGQYLAVTYGGRP